MAPCSASVSSVLQWVVAVSPSSRPAAASTSEPVHTEVVNVVVSCAVADPVEHALVVHQRPRADAAGEHETSGRGWSSNVPSISMPSILLSERTTPRSWPMNVMSKSGIRWSTS